MVYIYPEVSRTFNEYLLLPNLTTKDCTIENVNLRTPLSRFNKGEEPALSLNIPFVSAIMQSVSDHNLGIALAKNGGLSFIYGSQSIETQVEMIHKIKKYKAGFVVSDTNLTENHTLQDVLALKKLTGHSTIAITDDGAANGKLLGVVTDKDYRLSRDIGHKPIKEFMTPFDKLIVGNYGVTLSQANDIIWSNKINCLPIVTDGQRLKFMVFRKDYDDHKQNPYSLKDKDKRLLAGAGINSRDYTERVPALVEAGVDVLCIDSSDGFSEYQKDTIEYAKANFGDRVKIGAGNIVDREGFNYLVEAGADFIKVGIGGGSICTTREQKGIGRGQASAIIEVAKARDDLYQKTGVYVPICSDGGIVHDYHITLALAMGANFVMMGRYFARFDESPAKKVKIGNRYVKEYWGEGTNRAKNWQRYESGEATNALRFEEGVDSYVPYAGKLRDNLDITLNKIKSTMCSCGAKSLPKFQEVARLTVVSSSSIVEGSAHDVILKE